MKKLVILSNMHQHLYGDLVVVSHIVDIPEGHDAYTMFCNHTSVQSMYDPEHCVICSDDASEIALYLKENPSLLLCHTLCESVEDVAKFNFIAYRNIPDYVVFGLVIDQ